MPQGSFWTLNVSYTDPTTPSNSFTGALTFQLFKALTPNTVNMITEFTTEGFYVNSGKYFPRIVSDFGSPQTTVVQGGSTNIYGTGSSGQPGTPYANENVQAAGPHRYQTSWLLANAGWTYYNDTLFFITTVQAILLGYNYCVLASLVSGQTILAKIGRFRTEQSGDRREHSTPAKEPL